MKILEDLQQGSLRIFDKDLSGSSTMILEDLRQGSSRIFNRGRGVSDQNVIKNCLKSKRT
jgi:hypothetical protein